MKLLILFLLLPIFLKAELFWQNQYGRITIQGEISSLNPHFDETITLTLHATSPPEFRMETFQQWPNRLLSGLKLIAAESIEEKDGELKKTQIRYTLVPLVEGHVAIHLAFISFFNGSTPVKTFHPPPLTLNIPQMNIEKTLFAAPLAKTDTLHPIEISRANALQLVKPTSEEEFQQLFKQHTFPLGTLLFAIATIFSGIAVVLICKKLPTKAQGTTKIKLLRTLRKIEDSMLSLKLDPRHYQALNQQIRFFIQEKFGVEAPYLTTEEFLLQASIDKQIDPETREILKNFLKESDRVKFKGKTPSFQDIDASLKLVKKIISK
ncbi:hypothetical protein PHSC3_000124 [Chlamydiales bacterium STE3]|nr:hypothetical protein PHSC3_000124 [Chlamydiales bacterium STE3]